ncbi:MAG: SGNH/GDSL hydrolase family protein, partial [Phycisphaerae bacterium]|nr:SGNH/GDSL hydrolase family protein [Phycisphaerae bacterium]
MKTKRVLAMASVCVICLVAASTFAAPKRRVRRPNPAMAPITDTSGLPRVLLIGDSISIGYTLDTRGMLKGKANVHRIPVNGGDTARGLNALDEWLGKGKWDVIHFNWGLHDLKYMDPASRKLAGPPKGKQVRPVEKYAENLEILVKRMKKSGAKLIFATTTPVPKGCGGRVAGDAKRYNMSCPEISCHFQSDTISGDDHEA